MKRTSFALSILTTTARSSDTSMSWVGPSLSQIENGKILTSSGSTDFAISGTGADRIVDIFTTLEVTFDEEDGGIVDEWDQTVAYICRAVDPGHDCIYFDFQKLYNRDYFAMSVVRDSSTSTLPSLAFD